MKLLIIGGAGAFGSFYARLFKNSGFEVSLNDSDSTAAKKICESESFEFSDGKNLDEFDIVVLSTPNDAAPNILKGIFGKLKKGALLFDFCSVKSVVEKEYTKWVNAGNENQIELASIHPMHGPRVTSISGFPVVIIAFTKSDKMKLIKNVFSKEGAEVFEVSAKEHDEVLSIVQGLTHYSQFVSSAVINAMNIDLRKSLKFSTPNYSLFISLMSRIMLQNPELYAQIQLSNPYNEIMRKHFSKCAGELEALCGKNDSLVLKKKIISDAQIFKDPEVFLAESDRAVNAVKYVITMLKSHIGKKFLVENMATHSFHYGKIISVNGELCIEEKCGKSCMSLSKIRLCSKEEMKEWKNKHLVARYLDYSFLVPKECSTEVILSCLRTLKSCSFTLMDEYESAKLPMGTRSLLIRANFFEDDDKSTINNEVKNILLGLGFTIR